MPNLLAMSFEGELAPSVDLTCLAPGRKLPDGWGIGYYPGGEPSASVLKEPAPHEDSARGAIVRAWEHLASSLFVLHVRTAKWGSPCDANTQPFLRSYGGRDFLIAHSGSLVHRLEPPAGPVFAPVGSTDTERVFCHLLAWMSERGYPSLGDVPPEALRRWFEELNALGALTTVLTDGRDLCVYADAHGDGAVYAWRVLPPYERLAFGDADVDVDLTKRGVIARKGIVVASEPLVAQGGAADWVQVSPGHLLVIRQGALRAEAYPATTVQVGEIIGGEALRPVVLRRLGWRTLARPAAAPARTLEVHHRTTYRYARPVEKSAHMLRLQPIHDALQHLVEHTLAVSVDGATRAYEDVFGNHVAKVSLDRPFSELIIHARSVVLARDTDPFSASTLHVRSTIPLVWMPWQRQTLQPFLLPPELPESQLEELGAYAMSFVARNDGDLLDTLLDLNGTIAGEYAYRQGSTNLATTPFEVYGNRRGVCQDFANLFICLARLLGVPARYVCGYVYTGAGDASGGLANAAQGEASHAWVQVYLPEMGWKGFDPTNGIVTQTDHVRVAVGRSFVDATPTAGTIFVGGGAETLDVEVTCSPIAAQNSL